MPLHAKKSFKESLEIQFVENDWQVCRDQTTCLTLSFFLKILISHLHESNISFKSFEQIFQIFKIFQKKLSNLLNLSKKFSNLLNLSIKSFKSFKSFSQKHVQSDLLRPWQRPQSISCFHNNAVANPFRCHRKSFENCYSEVTIFENFEMKWAALEWHIILWSN